MIDKTEIKAILFDMDGTLVDSEPIGQETMVSFLNTNDISLTAEEWELFDKVWRRNGTTMSFEEFVANIFLKYKNISDVTSYIKNFYKEYENNILSAKPLPTVEETLRYLKSNYKLAVVTASTYSQARIVLEKNNWQDLFDVVISHDDFTKNKPDPESFLLASKKFEVEPQTCVVIEDSKNGALAGKNAGMYVIGVRAGNKDIQDLSAANEIVDKMSEIINLL